MLQGRNRLGPLGLAAMLGNGELAEALVAAGAAVEEPDWAHFTPLLVAAYFAHEKVTKAPRWRG